MKYKVHDKIICQSEIRKSGYKYLLVKEPFDSKTVQEVECDIIAIDVDLKKYTVKIPNDFVGWVVSNFHVEYYNFDKKYLNHKFFEIEESRILKLSIS